MAETPIDKESKGTPVDTATRGILRRELEALKRARKQGLPRIFYEEIKGITQLRFSQRKKLTDRQVVETKERLEKLVNVHLMPFVEFNTEIALGRFGGKTKCWFYWDTVDQEFSRTSDGVEFVDPSVELRFVRLFVDRKRVSLDDLTCSLIVSEHALMRMIQRGPVGESPLAYLGKRLMQYLPLVSLYTLATRFLDKEIGVALPLDDGLLLGAMSNAQLPFEEQQVVVRRRTVSDIHRVVMEPLVTANPFNKPDEANFIRISTYLDGDGLTDDKQWLYRQIATTARSLQEDAPYFTVPILNPEGVLIVDVIDKLQKGVESLYTLLNDSRWQRVSRPRNGF